MIVFLRKISYVCRKISRTIMKYPIGIQDFESIINGGYTYVDKTALIYRLVTEGKIYFLSRPRRFGKSLLVSTLKAYFRGKKELFNGLAIDGLEKEWAEYPVFHLDFNGVDFTQEGVLNNRINKWLSDYETIYGRNPNSLNQGDRFSDLLKAAHQQTGRRAVVLIDEYDKPLLDILNTGFSTIVDGEKRLLDFPNDEVKKGFVTLVANDYLKTRKDVSNWTQDVVDALEAGDLEQFRKLFKVGTVFSSETGTISEFAVKQ